MKNLQDKQWFLDRTFNRIFRNDNGCKCETCKYTLENGIVISGPTHAEYLYDTQNDFAQSGVLLNYRSTK